MDRRRTEDVLFYALNCAIDNQQSLADAWGNDEAEEAVREAKKDIAAFRLLKKRLFGSRKSRKEQFFEQPAKVITIFELRKFLEENPELVVDVTTDKE